MEHLPCTNHASAAFETATRPLVSVPLLLTYTFVGNLSPYAHASRSTAFMHVKGTPSSVLHQSRILSNGLACKTARYFHVLSDFPSLITT
jgi:hypothetical protein